MPQYITWGAGGGVQRANCPFALVLNDLTDYEIVEKSSFEPAEWRYQLVA